MSRAINHYVDLEHSFGRSRECRFLFDILKAMEDGDEEQYKFFNQSFNNVFPLLPWKKDLLAVGLEHMKAAADDFS